MVFLRPMSKAMLYVKFYIAQHISHTIFILIHVVALHYIEYKRTVNIAL